MRPRGVCTQRCTENAATAITPNCTCTQCLLHPTLSRTSSGLWGQHSAPHTLQQPLRHATRTVHLTASGLTAANMPHRTQKQSCTQTHKLTHSHPDTRARSLALSPHESHSLPNPTQRREWLRKRMAPTMMATNPSTNAAMMTAHHLTKSGVKPSMSEAPGL